jgi:hypothetical protein
MRNRLFKMLMNKEGASPGGGAAPPSPGQPPAEPGAPPTSVVPLDQVKGLVDQAVERTRNGIFADLRKAGVFKDDKPAGGGEHGAGGDKPPAPGSTQSLDPTQLNALLERRDTFTRVATKAQLTDPQFARMRAAFQSENPSDVTAWSSSYLTDMGLVKDPTAPPNAGQPPPQDPNVPKPPAGSNAAPPRSDKGPPSPGDAKDYDKALLENPLELTKVDIERLRAKYGFEEANAKIKDNVMRALAKVKVVGDPRDPRIS